MGCESHLPSCLGIPNFRGFAIEFHPLQINTEMASFLQGTAQDILNQRHETKTHFDSDEQREFLFIFDF